MVVRAHLRVRHHGCVSERFQGDTWLMQISGERGWGAFVLRAPGPAALEAGLALCGSNGSQVSILTRTDECVVFEGTNPPGGIVSAIRDSGCWIHWPVVYRDGHESFTVVAPARAALRGLHERLAAIADVTIERVVETPSDLTTHDLHVEDLVSDLTPRQLSVILYAVKNGYYRNPKAITSERIAASLGVAPSTVREHMRKAEGTLLGAISRILEQHPDASARAKRKRGRPASATSQLARR